MLKQTQSHGTNHRRQLLGYKLKKPYNFFDELISDLGYSQLVYNF